MGEESHENPGHAPVERVAEIRRKNAALAYILAAIGLILLAQWIYNLAFRIPFPFPVEYVEDAIFHQSLRVANGLPVYMDPNSGYAATIYTPGYFYILAGLFKVFGPSIVTGRIVSLVCALGIIVLLARISSRRLRFPLSIVPLCVYFSLPYAYFHGYQDLGRVDILMVLMIFSGLYLLNDHRAGAGRVIVGTVLLTLACYVKQPALAYLYFVYIYLFVRFRKTGFIAILISFALLAGIFFVLDSLTGGWFGFYTWELPMTHDYDWSIIATVFTGGRAHAINIMGMISLTLALLAYIIARLFTLRLERLNAYEMTLPGAMIATIGPFMKEGGHFQDMIPLMTHICFLLPYALSLPLFIKHSHTEVCGTRTRDEVCGTRLPYALSLPLFIKQSHTEVCGTLNRDKQNRGSHLVTSTILFLLMLHCVSSMTPWDDFRPTPDNIRLGNDFVDKIRQIDGDVLMPSMTYYAWLAGKEQDYLGVSLMDLLHINMQPYPLIKNIEDGRYAAICLPYYFDAEGYWRDSLREYGYVGPLEIIEFPGKEYDLCITVEEPPNKVYWRK